MVALLRHQPVPARRPRPALARSAEPGARHLRLVGGTEIPGPRPAGERPRPGHGFVAATGLPWPSLAAVVVVAVVVSGLFGAIRAVQGGPGSASVTPDGAMAAPDGVMAASDGVIGGRTAWRGAVSAGAAGGDLVVTVAPGDSLWAIAASVAPDRDPRPVVAALAEANGGDSLRIGQQIVIPGHLLD